MVLNLVVGHNFPNSDVSEVPVEGAIQQALCVKHTDTLISFSELSTASHGQIISLCVLFPKIKNEFSCSKFNVAHV